MLAREIFYLDGNVLATFVPEEYIHTELVDLSNKFVSYECLSKYIRTNPKSSLKVIKATDSINRPEFHIVGKHNQVICRGFNIIMCENQIRENLSFEDNVYLLKRHVFIKEEEKNKGFLYVTKRDIKKLSQETPDSFYHIMSDLANLQNKHNRHGVYRATEMNGDRYHDWKKSIVKSYTALDTLASADSNPHVSRKYDYLGF